MTTEPVDAAVPSLRVGRVVKVHGLDGAVRVESLTDFPERFRKGARLDTADRSLTVRSVQAGDGALIVHFDGISDRAAAVSLQGAYLTVPLADARALPKDRFYHFQLVGLSVVDGATSRPLGTIEEVLTYPANDVLRVMDGEREVLVPMVRTVVESIDLEGRRVVVRLPDVTQA